MPPAAIAVGAAAAAASGLAGAAMGSQAQNNATDAAANLAEQASSGLQNIDIPSIQYDPEIGIMGFEICISLERAGYRIKRRRLQKKRVPIKHRVSKQEAMEFMKTKFNVQVGA